MSDEKTQPLKEQFTQFERAISILKGRMESTYGIACHPDYDDEATVLHTFCIHAPVTEGIPEATMSPEVGYPLMELLNALLKRARGIADNHSAQSSVVASVVASNVTGWTAALDITRVIVEGPR